MMNFPDNLLGNFGKHETGVLFVGAGHAGARTKAFRTRDRTYKIAGMARSYSKDIVLMNYSGLYNKLLFSDVKFSRAKLMQLGFPVPISTALDGFLPATLITLIHSYFNVDQRRG